MLSATLRRYPDPTMSADPRIYTLLTDLRALDVAPAPRAHFRAELRAQLVAVAPRLVADGVAVERSATDRRGEDTAVIPAVQATPAVSRFAKLRALPLGRPVAIVTAVVAVFALLLGGAVWVSKKSLPGDALYSLKRANENVQLSLADGPTAKSKAYLNFAGERVDEVTALLKRSSAVGAGAGLSAGGISPHTASLVDSTLSSGDGDVRDAVAAARRLGRRCALPGTTVDHGGLGARSVEQVAGDRREAALRCAAAARHRVGPARLERVGARAAAVGRDQLQLPGLRDHGRPGSDAVPAVHFTADLRPADAAHAGAAARPRDRRRQDGRQLDDGRLDVGRRLHRRGQPRGHRLRRRQRTGKHTVLLEAHRAPDHAADAAAHHLPQ